MKRGKIEKDSQFDSLARDLLLELNAMKTETRKVSAKHEKQVEQAIHEFYKKLNGLRLTVDKSKAEAMRVAMDRLARSISRP